MLLKNTHDQILLQGSLVTGAVVSFHMRCDLAGNGKAIQWWIYGTEGEIEVTAMILFLQVSTPGTTLKVYNSKPSQEQVVPLEWKDAETGNLIGPSANVARIYEAFRKGETDRFARFEDSFLRHRFIDAMYKASG